MGAVVNPPLADRVMVLRDEVLDTASTGDRDPPGAEIFDAIVRALVVLGDTDPGLDHTLHDAISRRLAWGDTEDLVLSDAEQIYDRLVRAAQRSFADPGEEMLVIEISAEVTCATARMVAMAALGRAGRERAARMREELAHRRLTDALERQKAELDELERQRPGTSTRTDW
jgi:hypothetical protein